VDEEQYRQASRSVNQVPCPFEKLISSRRCDCELAQRTNIAEREVVGCRSENAQQVCVRLVAVLRQNATFALKLTGQGESLPHGKAMKLLGGGLLGLQAILNGDIAARAFIADVHGLVTSAFVEFGGDLSRMPFAEIVRWVSAYEVRSRTRTRNR
jgi:hypothetical protein